MSKTPYEKGLELRYQMFGKTETDEMIAAASGFTEPLQELVTRICFGEGWQRPVLDKKSRSLITLAILTALGRTHEIKIHTRGALANGVSVEEIRELFLHSYLYCGIPLVVDAFRASEAVLKAGEDES